MMRSSLEFIYEGFDAMMRIIKVSCHCVSVSVSVRVIIRVEVMFLVNRRYYFILNSSADGRLLHVY